MRTRTREDHVQENHAPPCAEGRRCAWRNRFRGAARLCAGRQEATKVHDFETYADVAKAEQEGELVFYCHENEAGTAAIMEGFGKDFPKIKTSYVRAQTGALYNKILSERSAGRFDVDVLQLSDVAPAVDFEKRGGYEIYTGPYMDAYKKDYLSATAGAYFWTGVTFAGLAYNKTQGHGRGIPKTYKDINNPRFRNKISCKISSSGIQYVQWYLLRQIYGNDFWKEFAKQRPRAFDSRVQLFDRLAKGDDDMTALAEYSAYVLYKQRGADVEFVGAARGAGRDAADRRRGEQGAASGSREAVRRLGDVDRAGRNTIRITRTSITAR